MCGICIEWNNKYEKREQATSAHNHKEYRLHDHIFMKFENN